MLRIEAHQMYRSNGLIDDLVVYGKPDDYVRLSKAIKSVIASPEPVVFDCDSEMCIEISLDNEGSELFTSLQNESNEYFSMKEWNARKILRVVGSESVLGELYLFLVNLSGRGEGYSYISEFSTLKNYSQSSPEWRLHVENT